MTRTALVAALAVTGLAALPAAAGASHSAASLAAACTDGPTGANFAPDQTDDVREIARCVVRRLRAERGLRTRTDRRLQFATAGALRVAVGRRDDAIGNAKVTEALVRNVCRKGQVARVRWSGADTYDGADKRSLGAARTPVTLAAFLRDQPHLVRRGTRVAVSTRAGRFFSGGQGGAVAVLATSMTCRS